MRSLAIILIALLPLSLGGCIEQAVTAQKATVEVQTLYQSNQCRLVGGIISQEKGVWINDTDQLSQFIPVNTKGTLDQFSVNFNREGVVALFLGTRPSSGYALELAESMVEISNNIAKLYVVKKEPAKGMLQAQLITHPCLLLVIERNSYRQIDVIDQHGNKEWSISRNNK